MWFLEYINMRKLTENCVNLNRSRRLVRTVANNGMKNILKFTTFIYFATPLSRSSVYSIEKSIVTFIKFADAKLHLWTFRKRT